MLSSTLRLLKKRRRLSLSSLAKKYSNAKSPFNSLESLRQLLKKLKLLLAVVKVQVVARVVSEAPAVAVAVVVAVVVASEVLLVV